jgi:hypothetical protein
MLDIALMAVSTVNLLIPFLKKAAEKGAEKLGESTAGTLFEVLKNKLKSPTAQEALADLQKKPEDADSQAALRAQVRKALENDPELGKLLHELVGKAGESTHAQVANVTGDGSRVAQIQGSGNMVS